MLFECRSLAKCFGSLNALDNISFQIAAGEVVGLVGRSGAGKSVLSQVLAGLIKPSSGTLLMAGRTIQWPQTARKHGIVVVPQQPVLAERLDITANLFLGTEPGRAQWLGWLRIPDQQRMDARAHELLAQLDLQIDSLRTPVSQLSSEQRQLITIARAMASPARMIVLDEPSELLSYGYQQRLLALIRNWQQQGIAVLFASSSLDHIFAITDRIMVLNEGRKVLDARTDTLSRETVVAASIGQNEHQQLTPIIWALEGYYTAREQAERLRLQQRRLERDLAAQDTLNQQLIKQLAEQVKSLDQANQALQDAQRRVLTEREDERKLLARELHDQVIQDLLSLNFQIEELENEHDPPVQTAELDAIRASVRALVDDVRRICRNLRPPTIDSLGLGAALQSFVRDWSQRSGIAVTLTIDPSIQRLPEELELSIFRIVQEGLANVRKHAQAHSVNINLTSTSLRSLGITIADDGHGIRNDFDLATLAQSGHYGLLGISERVALLRGKLRIHNQPSSGLVIEAEIPHPRARLLL
jgi:signal transduction histidine kinase